MKNTLKYKEVVEVENKWRNMERKSTNSITLISKLVGRGLDNKQLSKSSMCSICTATSAVAMG